MAAMNMLVLKSDFILSYQCSVLKPELELVTA